MVGLYVEGGATMVARRGVGFGTVGRAGGEVSATVAHVRMDG